MDARPAASRIAAQRLAERLNIIPIALFALWLGPMLMFWAQAFGPLRPFDVAPPPHSAFPWFVAALVGAAGVLLLPAGWYRVQRFEASGKLYRSLGVALFRGFVTNGDLINRAVARRYPSYRVYRYSTLLEALARNCFLSERSHLVAFAAGAVTSLYAGLIEWIGWAAWLTATNVACNLYPVLVQRLTRTRLASIRRPKDYSAASA